MKAIYQKPTANIILNGQKLCSGTRQECLLSPLPFNIVLEVLATAIRQEEEIKGTQSGKEEMKLSLFANDMIVYIENPINSTKTYSKLISELAKQPDTKSIFRNQRHFCTPTMKQQKHKSGQKFPFDIATRKIKYLGINLTKEVKDLYSENYTTLKK